MLKIILLLVLPSLVFAEIEGTYTFKEPVVIDLSEHVEGQSMGQILGDSSRFNYYENQSLRSFSSVFVEGVDQRFLDLNFNGFSLRDPSSPTGVFNVAALSSLRAVSLDLAGGSAINVGSEKIKKNFAGASVSNLQEAELMASYGACSSRFCSSLETSLKRGGGYSQLESGSEKDYFEEVSFSGSQSYSLGKTVLTTRLLYYGQLLDLDSVGPLGSVTVESSSAEALNSVLFVGQDFDFSKKHRLMLSYTSSYRNQKDVDLNLSFRQQGEVLESIYIYKNNFKFKVFHEQFNIYSSKDEDVGFNLQRNFVFKDLIIDLSVGKTKLRSLNWSAEAGYKNFVLFYKGVPPSLFQQSYNDEFSSASTDLKSQAFVGFRYSRLHRFSLLNFKWNLSYSRIYDFVDFDLVENSYSNLGEVENFFIGVNLMKGPVTFTVQNQVARQLENLRLDLPRRAPWTLGLRYKKIFKSASKSNFELSGGVRWLSKRRAFDQDDLEATWMSDLRLSYGNLSLNCTNVFSESDAVFKNLGRKPFAASLAFQKNF